MANSKTPLRASCIDFCVRNSGVVDRSTKRRRFGGDSDKNKIDVHSARNSRIWGEIRVNISFVPCRAHTTKKFYLATSAVNRKRHLNQCPQQFQLFHAARSVQLSCYLWIACCEDPTVVGEAAVACSYWWPWAKHKMRLEIHHGNPGKFLQKAPNPFLPRGCFEF